MNRILFILLLLLFQTGFAQPIFKKTQIHATLGSIVSSDSTTPFLLRSKQYGLVPVKSGIGYFNLSLKKEYDSLYTTTSRKLKKFSYGYGLETHVNFGKTNQILLPVVHIKARYGAFELYGGRRREIQGLVDTLGTIGSYIWSGNALPMPKIEISIPNFTPISKNGLIAIKGNFAHGWFGKGDSVQNVWLHQKSFYARIGKPAWKFHLLGGFNHQVQWGGHPTKPFYDELSKQIINRFSTDFSTFIKVATGISLNSKGQGASSGAPANEALNRAGNHLGSVDIGLNFTMGKYNIFFYRQSFYEDGSLFYLNNIADGLYGLSISQKNSFLSKICLEYLDTRNQGGTLFEWTPELRGRDDYFNNSLYKDAWTYKGNTLGTPLFVSNQTLLGRPSYAKNLGQSNFIINNRLSAIQMNLYYHYKSFYGNTQIIQSKNLGNYEYPFKYAQVSFMQQINTFYKSYKLSGKIASDFGELWKDNFGINLSIAKQIR
ncbi:capsule assembly Wzi family protein [Lacihabitans sp. CS3-21]|uniref:capsule assembly Wzi family protein n=1 Tax=Lacihabitans sp. CS3-21 TaxID=2487332 RepID=UPI0020CD2619|nr:capsule assembly Wzi family protein [Lacihabitans sp. CS3-21]